MAQYTNPYSGATWNNSFSRMMDMTRTWNQNLWRAQQQVQQVTAQTAAMNRPSPPVASHTTEAQSSDGPHFPEGTGGKYSITATDFPASPEPLQPGEFVDLMSTLTASEREELRARYLEWLRGYETFARPNNLANSIAYVAAQSLRVMRGWTGVPAEEIDQLIAYFNDVLVDSPEFSSLTLQQKQFMYENAVITGNTIWSLEVQGLEQNNAAMQAQARHLADSVIQHLTLSATRGLGEIRRLVV